MNMTSGEFEPEMPVSVLRAPRSSMIRFPFFRLV